MKEKTKQLTQPMSVRKCICNEKGCRYCRDRRKYEEHYDSIMARYRAVSKLKQIRRKEVLSMPPDVLIHEVLEEDEV